MLIKPMAACVEMGVDADDSEDGGDNDNDRLLQPSRRPLDHSHCPRDQGNHDFAADHHHPSSSLVSFIVVVAVVQTSRSCGTAGPAVIDSGGPSSIVKSPNIRCFVAKSGLSRFTRFLGVRFSAFDSNKYCQIGQ